MGFAENIRILSNISCGVASLNSYLEQRANGVPSGYASYNLLGNLTNGFIRNEMAYDMQRYGYSYGNYLNSWVGYGNPVSNAIGTMGMLAAYTPWTFFNLPCGFFTPMPMGCFGGLGMGFGSYSITTTTGFRHNAFCC